MSMLTGSKKLVNSSTETSGQQGMYSAETGTSQSVIEQGSQDGVAPRDGQTGAIYTSMSNSSSIEQAETKHTLAKTTEILREDAGQAAEEMRKRAARYRETPKDTTDQEISAQMKGLHVDDDMAMFDKIFEPYPVAIGKAISKMEREDTKRNGDSTLVYGEITFKTLALALHKVRTKYGLPGVGSSGEKGVLQDKGGAFYDIGSGTGKPVIAAAIFHPFHKAVGIEILEGLHATSMEILKQWEGGIRDRVEHQPPTRVKFVHGDALDLSICDWSDGDVVFANSTCFDDALMWKLASAATALKKGAIFITLTRRMPVAYFKVLEHDMFPMSWGSATVYISQKTTDPFGDPNQVEEGPRVMKNQGAGAGIGGSGGSHLYKEGPEFQHTGTE